jgi:hypothetical protein
MTTQDVADAFGIPDADASLLIRFFRRVGCTQYEQPNNGRRPRLGVYCDAHLCNVLDAIRDLAQRTAPLDGGSDAPEEGSDG